MTWVLWDLASFHLETLLLLVQDWCMVYARSLTNKSFWMNSMVRPVDETQVEACFGHSDMVLILTQDRCTVCIERTIGSAILLDAPDGTPR